MLPRMRSAISAWDRPRLRRSIRRALRRRGAAIAYVVLLAVGMTTLVLLTRGVNREETAPRETGTSILQPVR